MTFVVLQVSDTHLSATHAYFTDNWQVFVDEVRALAPDLVINTGDFSFNGPAVVEDLAFSHAEAERLGVRRRPVRARHRIVATYWDQRRTTWQRTSGRGRPMGIPGDIITRGSRSLSGTFYPQAAVRNGT